MSKSVRNRLVVCLAIILAVLIGDQWIKIWIKTSLPIFGDIPVLGDWFHLYFVENEGIAFGLSFGGSIGKYFLSLFRMAAVFVMFVLLFRQIRKEGRYTMLISIALILVGALGNLIDSCFYGLIFSESTPMQVAEAFPENGGYTGFLLGKVVDMFYFPIAHWTWPDWMPWIGGNEAEFFSAIFNLADAAVTCGVTLLIVDQLFIAPRYAEAAKCEALEETEGNDGAVESEK